MTTNRIASRAKVPRQIDSVHNRIAQATVAAHSIMEACMQDILKIEGWDPETLKMPDNLRDLLLREAME